MNSNYKIIGISLPVFIIFSLIIFITIYLDVVPTGMVGAFPIMIILGSILNEIGNNTPIIKDYLGGGPIIIIFGSAAVFTYNLIPEATETILINFTRNGSTFLSFYIAALITGSIARICCLEATSGTIPP